MAARGKRSRKRSAANWTEQLSSVRLLIDECLGTRVVPDALTAAGARVVLHRDLFEPGLSDVEWLWQLQMQPDVLVLTKDARIKSRSLEREAVMASRVRLFALTSSNLTGAKPAAAFHRALKRIIILSRRPGPFIARVSALGYVTIIDP